MDFLPYNSAYLLIGLTIPLFATDNEGGRAIAVSIATSWYSSNHFAPYGNLYYRFSSTLADLFKMDDGNLSHLEAKEKAHHFSLKMISLFSLLGLGLFLGWNLFGSTSVVPLFGIFFTLVSTRMPMWVEWIYRPHPEHLLNFCLVISIYMFAKLLKEMENTRTFILSAFSWGLAMAFNFHVYSRNNDPNVISLQQKQFKNNDKIRWIYVMCLLGRRIPAKFWVLQAY